MDIAGIVQTAAAGGGLLVSVVALVSSMSSARKVEKATLAAKEEAEQSELRQKRADALRLLLEASLGAHLGRQQLDALVKDAELENATDIVDDAKGFLPYYDHRIAGLETMKREMMKGIPSGPQGKALSDSLDRMLPGLIDDANYQIDLQRDQKFIREARHTLRLRSIQQLLQSQSTPQSNA